MIGVTVDQIAAYSAGASVLFSVVGGVGALYFNAVNRSHGLEMRNIKEFNERVETSLKASWIKIDDLRDRCWRREEQKEFRDEVKFDMKALGDRLEKSIDGAVSALKQDIREHGKNGS